MNDKCFHRLQLKQRSRIVACNGINLLKGKPKSGGYVGCGVNNIGTLVALASVWNWRKIWRIGF